MKHSLLALALLSAFALTACNRDEPAVETPVDDTTAQLPTDPAMAEPAADDAAMASDNPMVGGAPMLADRDIIDNAVNSKDHTTLVTAVKAAGLVDTLKGTGPFTVFAPTNDAFGKLPAGTVDKLVTPAMKADLTKVLTYHVVPGTLDAAALMAQIEAGGGRAMLTTVQGAKLTASMHDADSIMLTDGKGGMAMVTIADVMQSNGVIHVIDTVLMP